MASRQTSLTRLAARDRFRLDVGLAPERVVDRFLAHAEVRKDDRPYPYPPPPHGKRFLIWDVSPHGFCLRHYAGPLDPASPVAVVTLKPKAHGTRVKIRFSRVGGRRPLNLTPEGVLTGLILIGIVGTVAGVLGKVITMLFGVVWLALAGLLLSMTYPRNGMRVYGSALRGIIGELLAPHALEASPERDPYRLLPAPALAHTPHPSSLRGSARRAPTEEWPSGRRQRT